MKKILFLICLLGSFALANAQTVTQKVAIAGSTTKNMVVSKGGLRSDSTMGFPNRDTTYTPERLGDVVIRPQDHLMYVYLGNWYVFQNSPKNIYASQGLHAINDSTMGFGGHFTADDTISLSSVYSMLFDSTVHWRIRGSNTQALDASTIFEVQSTVRGVLFSKMTTAQMNAIASPTSGLMVYNIDSSDYCVYNGSIWIRSTNLYAKDDGLYGDRSLSGNNHFLSLGTNGSQLNFANIYSASTIGLFGIPTLSAFPTIADANYVAPANQSTFKLPVITANRTFTPPASGGNKMIYIWSGNNLVFTWSPVAGSFFKDATGTNITVFQPNTFYTFMNDGTNWIEVASALTLNQVLLTGNTSALAMQVGNFKTVGSFTVPFVSTAISYAVLSTDVIIQATASNITITLPTASTNAGRILYVKNISAGNVNLSGMASGEFNVMAPFGTLSASVTLYSDGVGWRVGSEGD